ncbi:MAG: hypothetical protein K9M15_01300 [Candidatus Marinimicrobia bacterium]|nr:hypothetical protein [Candidatus Neomarinimicrobiota bacterium]
MLEIKKPVQQEKQSSENISSKPIKWRCLEYEYHPKTSDWFWFVASGVLIIVITAILMKNFLFAVIAVLAGFILTILGTKKPQEIEFCISGKGVEIGEKIYPYKELDAFWVNYNPPIKKELILKSKKKLVGLVKIPLDHTDPNMVRKNLSRVLKEEEIEESLVETIADWLRF